MSNNDYPQGDEVKKYGKNYSDDGLWDKLTDHVQEIGASVIYNALKLYYAAQNPACPMKVKAGIYAALGYFIVPLDLIPDFTPVAGYADDASAIGAALLMAQMYIDDSVRQSAKERIKSMFGDNILKHIEEA